MTQKFVIEKQSTCSNKKHKNKLIIAICYEFQCINKRKLCLQCQKEHEKQGHKTERLRSANSQIHTNLNVNWEKQSVKQKQQIDNYFVNLGKIIQDLFYTMIKARQKLNDKYLLVEPMKKTIMNTFDIQKISQNIQNIVNQETKREQIQALVKIIKILEKPYFKNIIQLHRTIKVMVWKIVKAIAINQQILNQFFTSFLDIVKEWSLFERLNWENDIAEIQRSMQEQIIIIQQKEKQKYKERQMKKDQLQLKQKNTQKKKINIVKLTQSQIVKIDFICIGRKCGCKGKERLCSQYFKMPMQSENIEHQIISLKQFQEKLYKIKINYSTQPKQIYEQIKNHLNVLSNGIQDLFYFMIKAKDKLKNNYLLVQPMHKAIMDTFKLNTKQNTIAIIKSSQTHDLEIQLIIKIIKGLGGKAHFKNVQMLKRATKIMTWKIQNSAIACKQNLKNTFNAFLQTVKQWSFFQRDDWQDIVPRVEQQIKREKLQQQKRILRIQAQRQQKIIEERNRKKSLLIETVKNDQWKPAIEWLMSQKDITELNQLLLYGIRSHEGANVKNNIMTLQNLDILINLQKLLLHGHLFNKIQINQPLEKLITLSLNNNKIEKIQNLHGMKKLKWLYLSNNLITKIQNLQTLINLDTLHLAQNKISKIENISTLINLHNLNLHDNKIRKIQNLEALINLQSLDLRNNKIKQIQNLSTLTNLVVLTFRNMFMEDKIQSSRGAIEFNQITIIQNLQKLSSLKTISFVNNRITSVEDNLQNLTNLQHLNLCRNPLLASDETRKNIEKLQKRGVSVFYEDPLSLTLYEYYKQIKKKINFYQFDFFDRTLEMIIVKSGDQFKKLDINQIQFDLIQQQ